MEKAATTPELENKGKGWSYENLGAQRKGPDPGLRLQWRGSLLEGMQ